MLIENLWHIPEDPRNTWECPNLSSLTDFDILCNEVLKAKVDTKTAPVLKACINTYVESISKR